MNILQHPDPKVERLGHLPLFTEADPAALAMLASVADEVTVAAGHTLITQGRHHGQGFVVEAGTATVEVDGEVVAEISAGEMVGELSLLDPGPATATVRAQTDLEVLVIPSNHFDQIMNDNPDLVKAVARELAARLRAMDARTTDTSSRRGVAQGAIATAPDPDPRRWEPGEPVGPLAQC